MSSSMPVHVEVLYQYSIHDILVLLAYQEFEFTP